LHDCCCSWHVTSLCRAVTAAVAFRCVTAAHRTSCRTVGVCACMYRHLCFRWVCHQFAVCVQQCMFMLVYSCAKATASRICCLSVVCGASSSACAFLCEFRCSQGVGQAYYDDGLLHSMLNWAGSATFTRLSQPGSCSTKRHTCSLRIFDELLCSAAYDVHQDSSTVMQQ
jgi:hypothetical protein